MIHRVAISWMFQRVSLTSQMCSLPHLFSAAKNKWQRLLMVVLETILQILELIQILTLIWQWLSVFPWKRLVLMRLPMLNQSLHKKQQEAVPATLALSQGSTPQTKTMMTCIAMEKDKTRTQPSKRLSNCQKCQTNLMPPKPKSLSKQVPKKMKKRSPQPKTSTLTRTS